MEHFSLNGYSELIRAIEDHGINCRSFKDGADSTPNTQVCLLRHDVDVSIQCAVRLARLEANLGVTSTYFVMVNSDFYNTFTRANQAALREMVSLNHEVGLHWWRSRYPENFDALQEGLRRDLRMLGDLVGAPILSAAQHDPVTDVPSGIGNLVRFDAYDPRFFRNIRYVSDSNRVFRTDPFQLVESGVRSFQMNLHPLYWVTDARNMGDCFREAFKLETSVSQGVLEQTVGEYEEALRDRLQRDAHFRACYDASVFSRS